MKKSNKQYIIDENGQKKAATLPIEEYEELLADIHDLAIVAERRNEPILNLKILKKI
ncbi:type II toxin-antitoxin system Phd/YefM family antitoxin [candidate division WOR-3 bacterium]|nr:type II toxin-antitoxin system Phd/YefM family antitoxin [candidate division WOR-3 bacterium]